MSVVPDELYNIPEYNDTRREVAGRIYGVLFEYNHFNTMNRNERINLMTQIERSCYNYAIRQCQNMGYYTVWDEPKFVQVYADTTYRVISNIDPTSSVKNVKTYDQILSGKFDPFHLGDMSSREFCPELTADIERTIAQRSAQNIDAKVSTRFKCPQCGKSETFVKEVQTRSLDEGGTLSAICKFCSHLWHPNG
jgi:DNA-directed RNA polymerase subunit M/transcription elongation factor TFIIS